MALICFSGINTNADGETHVTICLGTEGDDAVDAAPFFFTVTIAGPVMPQPGDLPGESGPNDAQRHRIPISTQDVRNLRRWIEQIVPPDDQ